MRSMDSAEVRALVQVLADKIARSSDPLEAHDIGSALYGT